MRGARARPVTRQRSPAAGTSPERPGVTGQPASRPRPVWSSAYRRYPRCTDLRRALALLAQDIQLVEGIEYDVGVDAEVNQAGDLVHADGLQTRDKGRACLRRADEGTGLEVPLESVSENLFALSGSQVGEVFTCVLPQVYGRL